MAPTYKGAYFPFTAICESTRYLLCYGGVKYDAKSIYKRDLPKNKEDMSPRVVLLSGDANGKNHESIAIARYLGKQFKLTGENDWEDLEIDAIVDTVNDFSEKVSEYFRETDQEGQAKRKEIIDKEVIPYYLDRLEAIAKENKGHLALKKLTWADLYFASLVRLFNVFCKYSGIANMFAGRENLKAVIDNVENLPAIKAWFAKRPKSEYYWHRPQDFYIENPQLVSKPTKSTTAFEKITKLFN